MDKRWGRTEGRTNERKDGHKDHYIYPRLAGGIIKITEEHCNVIDEIAYMDPCHVISNNSNMMFTFFLKRNLF